MILLLDISNVSLSAFTCIAESDNNRSPIKDLIKELPLLSVTLGGAVLSFQPAGITTD